MSVSLPPLPCSEQALPALRCVVLAMDGEVLSLCETLEVLEPVVRPVFVDVVKDHTVRNLTPSGQPNNLSAKPPHVRLSDLDPRPSRLVAPRARSESHRANRKLVGRDFARLEVARPQRPAAAFRVAGMRTEPLGVSGSDRLSTVLALTHIVPPLGGVYHAKQWNATCIEPDQDGREYIAAVLPSLRCEPSAGLLDGQCGLFGTAP